MSPDSSFEPLGDRVPATAPGAGLVRSLWPPPQASYAYNQRAEFATAPLPFFPYFEGKTCFPNEDRFADGGVDPFRRPSFLFAFHRFPFIGFVRFVTFRRL